MNRANRPRLSRISGSSYASKLMGRAGDGSTLTLDFTTGSLDSRLMFTRASEATFINSSGYITLVNSDIARFDHNPDTRELKGLLIEGASSNIVKYSQDLNQVSGIAQWYGFNFNTPSVPVSPPTDPFGGTSSSWKLVASAGAGFHIWRFFATYTAADYTFSFWARPAEYDRIVLSDIGSGRGGCRFVLTGNGSATVIPGTITPTNASCILSANGWYRCAVTMTMTAANYAMGFAGYPVATTPSEFGANYTADGTSGVYATAVQAELGATASSYIATAAGTPTNRAADFCRMTGTNFSSWYQGGTQGTFYADWFGGVRTGASGSTNRTVLSTDDVATKHLHFLQTAAAGNLRVADFGGANNVTTANTLTSGARTKGAFGYNGSSASVCLNGGTVATGSSLAFSVDPTWLVIGATSTNGTSLTDANVVLNNSIRQIKYWPTRLADGTLQGLTT